MCVCACLYIAIDYFSIKVGTNDFRCRIAFRCILTSTYYLSTYIMTVILKPQFFSKFLFQFQCFYFILQGSKIQKFFKSIETFFQSQRVTNRRLLKYFETFVLFSSSIASKISPNKLCVTIVCPFNKSIYKFKWGRKLKKRLLLNFLCLAFLVAGFIKRF